MAGTYSRRSFLKQMGTLGATIALGGALSSCGSSGGSANTPSTGGSATPIASSPPSGGSASGTVNFFARGDEAIFKVFHRLRDEFQKREPNIQVQIEEVPGDFYQKFQLKLASGTPPDCLFECDCTITSSIRAGALEPLDSFIANDARFDKSDYLPIAWYTSEYEGKTYGLPYDGGSMAMFYNKDLFKQAGIPPLSPKEPITWDQLLEYGRKLTLDRNGKHPGEAGFDPRRIKQYAFDPQASWVPWLWVWGNGGEVITKDGKVPLDEPAAAEGLQFVADLGTKHYISPSPQFQQQGQISFLSGNVAMVFDGVWAMVRYRDAKFEWDVAPFPKGKVRVSTGWYSPLSMTAAARNKEAAWKWISFCCSEEGQRIVAELGQSVPPLKKLANSQVFLNPKVPPEHKQVFLDQLDQSILRTPGDKMGKYFGGYVVEFRDIFNPAWDAVLRGDKQAADAMKEVRPKLENLLKTGKVS